MAEAERARRAERPLTLAYFDLDNFKQLNDRLGHAAGDEALRCVVQTIQLYLRQRGPAGPAGGRRVRAAAAGDGGGRCVGPADAVAGAAVAGDGGGRAWPVTLSVGAVTFLRPLADVDLMIQRVDALMYGAKRKGKGRVEHAVVTETEALADPRPGIDRRATARALSNRTARIRREGEANEAFAAVRDVSSGGMALHMDHRLPDDTVLMVEALASGARTLLARVKHAAPEEGGWRHGCELSTRLSAEELHFWMGEQEGKGEGMRKVLSGFLHSAFGLLHCVHGAGRLAKNASRPCRHSSVSRGAALACAASSSADRLP